MNKTLPNNITERFADSLVDKLYSISIIGHIHKKTYDAVIPFIEYYNSLSKTKQLALVEDLMQLQVDYIRDSMNNGEESIHINRLGRLFQKPTKAISRAIRQEELSKGTDIIDINRKVMDAIIEHKKTKRISKVPVKLDCFPEIIKKNEL